MPRLSNRLDVRPVKGECLQQLRSRLYYKNKLCFWPILSIPAQRAAYVSSTTTAAAAEVKPKVQLRQEETPMAVYMRRMPVKGTHPCCMYVLCLAGVPLLPETYVVLMYGYLSQPDVRRATEWYRQMEAAGADPDQVRCVCGGGGSDASTTASSKRAGTELATGVGGPGQTR